jgi:hypothetical protein
VNHIQPPASPTVAPWRLLVLDRTPDDPRWLLVTVALPSDVLTAQLDAVGRYTNWDAATAWVRDNLGRPAVALTPVHDPLAWLVSEDGRPR